jgi:rhodanese-related sulfurtransferase
MNPPILTVMNLIKKLAYLFPLLFSSCLSQELPPESSKDEKVDAMIKQIETQFPQVPVITAKKLISQLKEKQSKIVIVDVRTPEEQAVSMIPNSISKKEFEKRKNEFKNRTIVPYCTIGYRSAIYTKKLQAQGHKAFNLEGSLLKWVRHGGTVEKGGKPTNKVHVYGKTWDLLPPSFESVYD